MAIIKTNRSKRTPYKKTTLGYAEDYITASSIIMNDGLSLQDVYNKMQKDFELFWNNNNQPINSNTLYKFDEPIPDDAKYLTIVIGVANDKNGMQDGNCGIETIMLNNDTLGKSFWIKCMANSVAYCNFAFSTDRKKCLIGDIYRGSGWGSVNLYINLYYGYELSTGQVVGINGNSSGTIVGGNVKDEYTLLGETSSTSFTSFERDLTEFDYFYLVCSPTDRYKILDSRYIPFDLATAATSANTSIVAQLGSEYSAYTADLYFDSNMQKFYLKTTSAYDKAYLYGIKKSNKQIFEVASYDTDWKNLFGNIENSNIDFCAYRCIDDNVHVEICLTGTYNSSIGNTGYVTIATLPELYRPSCRIPFVGVCPGENYGICGWLEINGDIKLYSTTATNYVNATFCFPRKTKSTKLINPNVSEVIYESAIDKFIQTSTAPKYSLANDISNYKRLKIYTVQNDGYRKTFEVWNNNKNSVTTQVDYQIPNASKTGQVYMQSVIYKIEGSTITGILCSDYLSNSTYRAMYDIGIERVVGYTY